MFSTLSSPLLDTDLDITGWPWMLLRLFQTAKTQGNKLITTAHNRRNKNEVNYGGISRFGSLKLFGDNYKLKREV